MKIDEGKILMLSLGIMTGILITSFIIKIPMKHTVLMTTQQYQKLNNNVIELKYEIKGFYKEYDELQQKINKYNESNQKEKSIYDELNKELSDAKLFYGGVDVEGPGLKIIINDNHDYSNNYNIIDVTTHNFDIYSLLNDLKSGGAEAISVNGKRILSTTAVTCEGPTVKINDEFTAPPFEILVIGDPDAMQYVLSQPESYFSVMKIRGLYLKIEKLTNVRINKIN